MTTEQILNELSSEDYNNLPRLGWVMTYEAPKTVEVLTVEKAKEIVARNGYDPDTFPTSDNKTYFAATRGRMQDLRLNAEPKVLIRPLGSKTASVIKYQVTIERTTTIKLAGAETEGLEHNRNLIIEFHKEKDKQGEHPLVFKKEGKQSADDRTFILDFEATYSKIRQNILSKNLQNFIWVNLHKMNLIRWRTTGGMFFTPDQYTASLEKLVKTVQDFGNGALLKRIPILNSEEQRQDISHSFDFEMELKIKNLNDDLDELLQKGRADGSLPEKLLQNRLNKYDRIMTDAKMYSTILQGRTDLVDKSLSVVKDKVEAVLAGQFKGIKAELSKREQNEIEREKRRASREAAKQVREDEKRKKAEAKADQKSHNPKAIRPVLHADNIPF
jgi:hypothetical protein